MSDDNAKGADLNPREFLCALVHISSKDAAKAREDSPATRPRRAQEGPTHDYGIDTNNE